MHAFLSRRWIRVLCCLVCVTCCGRATALRAEVRIQDITDCEGVRINQLTGLGLVTGLDGTGGDSAITRQVLSNFLQNMGLRDDPAVRALLERIGRNNTNNVAVVVVTAELPSFRRIGSTIDVKVSALDDSTSLRGGVLVPTPLTYGASYGASDEIYAMAAGSITVAGFTAQGAAASVQKNQTTTGWITSGATVERETCTEIAPGGRLRLLLRDPNFETASRITQVINGQFPFSSRMLDAATVEVAVPFTHIGREPEFLATIQALSVQPDIPARVVINTIAGTVVISENVRISRAAVTHGGLTVITSETPQVSQPLPFSEGETTVVPRTQLDVFEDRNPVVVLEETVTVADLVQALNALGATPGDLAIILQRLKTAGALHAEVIVE